MSTKTSIVPDGIIQMLLKVNEASQRVNAVFLTVVNCPIDLEHSDQLPFLEQDI